MITNSFSFFPQSDGHRMLIFSQWTRLLDLLEVLMDDLGIPYMRIDGSTPVRERQERIDAFTEDTSIPVFLLSTKAGGLGINLTAADTVILHDLDFNPENDKQAQDRCHRIGQTKQVTVYKFVSVDSVDEDIFRMGERKSKLSHAILSTEEVPAGKRASSAADEDGEGDDGDLGDIGFILQRALQRVQQRQTKAEP